jgi:hypothetical protein
MGAVIWWGQVPERPYGFAREIDEYQLVWWITPVDAPSRGTAVDPGSDFAVRWSVRDCRARRATSDKSARLLPQPAMRIVHAEFRR